MKSFTYLIGNHYLLDWNVHEAVRAKSFIDEIFMKKKNFFSIFFWLNSIIVISLIQRNSVAMIQVHILNEFHCNQSAFLHNIQAYSLIYSFFVASCFAVPHNIFQNYLIRGVFYFVPVIFGITMKHMKTMPKFEYNFF